MPADRGRATAECGCVPAEFRCVPAGSLELLGRVSAERAGPLFASVIVFSGGARSGGTHGRPVWWQMDFGGPVL